jgi:hypothetical protein
VRQIGAGVLRLSLTEVLAETLHVLKGKNFSVSDISPGKRNAYTET